MRISAIRILGLLLCLQLSAAAVCAQTTGIRKLNGDAISPPEIDRIVTELMESGNVTGLCLAVLNANETVYIETYGYRDKEKNELLDENTVVLGASFSKAVFSYIVLQLIQEGIMELDQPLYTYLGKPLPEYEEYGDLAGDDRWKQLTVRTCLSHTTGLPNFVQDEMKIYFDPGTRYAYSGEGFGLLQFVIEQVTGTDLEELAVERVFGPLGMNRTSYIWQDRFADNFATGHDIVGSPVNFGKWTRAVGGGSLLTTISDYAKFVGAIMRSEGLDRSTWRAMLSPSIRIESKYQFPTLTDETTDQYDSIELSYGLGWGLFVTEYGKAFFKEGHGPGCQNYNVNFVDQGTSIIIMTNSDNGESIFKDLLEQVIGDTYTPWEWERYVPYYLAEPMPIGRYLYDTILYGGVDKAVDTYRNIKLSSVRQRFVFDESQLNSLGYQMIRESKLDAAIKLFELNIEEYPGSANAFDSCGEAYMMTGQIDLAIERYSRSLELDQENDNAREILKKLRSGR